eukprot:826080_1
MRHNPIMQCLIYYNSIQSSLQSFPFSMCKRTVVPFALASTNLSLRSPMNHTLSHGNNYVICDTLRAIDCELAILFFFFFSFHHNFNIHGIPIFISSLVKIHGIPFFFFRSFLVKIHGIQI